MDQVQIGIIGSTLVAAILALWRFVMIGNKKCESRNDRLEGEIRAINTMLFKRSSDDAMKAESREKWAWDRSAELSGAFRGIEEMTRNTLRILKRYDPEITPPKEERLVRSHEPSDAMVPNQKKVSSTSETSRFVNKRKK